MPIVCWGVSRSSSIALTHTSCFFPCFISLFHRVQVHVASLIQRWWLLRVIQYKLLLRVNHQQDETHLAMASLVVRSILLATFVYSYLLLSTWFQLLPTWNTTLPLVQCSGIYLLLLKYLIIQHLIHSPVNYFTQNILFYSFSGKML